VESGRSVKPGVTAAAARPAVGLARFCSEAGAVAAAGSRSQAKAEVPLGPGPVLKAAAYAQRERDDDQGHDADRDSVERPSVVDEVACARSAGVVPAVVGQSEAEQPQGADDDQADQDCDDVTHGFRRTTPNLVRTARLPR
jgi:hypothetical protein